MVQEVELGAVKMFAFCYYGTSRFAEAVLLIFFLMVLTELCDQAELGHAVTSMTALVAEAWRRPRV